MVRRARLRVPVEAAVVEEMEEVGIDGGSISLPGVDTTEGVTVVTVVESLRRLRLLPLLVTSCCTSSVTDGSTVVVEGVVMDCGFRPRGLGCDEEEG